MIILQRYYIPWITFILSGIKAIYKLLKTWINMRRRRCYLSQPASFVTNKEPLVVLLCILLFVSLQSFHLCVHSLRWWQCPDRTNLLDRQIYKDCTKLSMCLEVHKLIQLHRKHGLAKLRCNFIHLCIYRTQLYVLFVNKKNAIMHHAYDNYTTINTI